MIVKFEFLGYIREKAGSRIKTVEVEQETPALYEALSALQREISDDNFRIVGEGKLEEGLLLFKKKENGGLYREDDLTASLTGGETIVLTTGMEGG